MKKALLFLLIFSIPVFVFGQTPTCPTMFNRNNGNGGASGCPGVGSTAQSSDVVGTVYQYSTCCTSAGSKTGDFQIKWTSSVAPTYTPAVKNLYIDGTLTTATVFGPPSAFTTVSSDKNISYCFYGSNVANSSRLTVEFVNPATGASYKTCNYTWSSGNGDLAPDPNPNITTNPASQTVCVGGTVTFSVAATAGTGGNTLTYQWRKAGTNISGATNTTYSIGSVILTDAADYTVVVTESNGAIASSTAGTLTVNNAPSLTSASNDGPKCAGSTLTLSANGASNVTTYAWTGPVAVTNSGTATGSVTSATTGASGIYSVVVTNGAGSGCSRTYTTTATINSNPNISNFTSPSATSQCTGVSSVVTVNSTSIGTGTFTVTYNLSGANSATGSTATLTMVGSAGTFSVSAGSLSTAGTTTVTITAIAAGGGCSSTVSTTNTASFTVNAPDVSNFSAASATSPCSGAASTVTVNSTSLGNGTYTVTYNLSGANSATGSTASLTIASNTGTFTIPSGSLGSTGATTVTVTSISNASSCSSNISTGNTASFTVNANPNVSNFSAASATSPCSGAASTVTVNSTSLGNGTYTVTYNLSGANSATGSTASLTIASNTGTFTVPSGSLGSTGATTVTVTSISNASSCSSSISTGNTASFTVNANPNVTSFSAASATSPCLGAASTVTVNSTSLGNGTYTVTYNLSGANSATGSTASLTIASNTGTFTIPSGSLGSAGATTVTVTSISNASSCSSNISTGNTASFTVNANPNVSSFSANASSPCLGGGSTVTVSSSSLGTATFTVTYNLSGANTTTGATANLSMSGSSGVFQIPFGLLASTGATTVTVTSISNASSCSSNISTGNTASFTVNANPNVSNFSAASATSPCSGAASTVTVNSTSLGNGTYTVTYNLSGANSATGSTASLTIASNTGTFTIPSGSLGSAGATTVTVTSISNASSCSSSISTGNTASFTVNANPDVSNFSANASSPCIGAASTVTVNSTSLGNGTYTVTYNLSGANSATGSTASLTIASNTGTFTIPSGSLGSTGATTVTVTSILNASSCSSSISTGNTSAFNVNPLPSAISGTATTNVGTFTTLSNTGGGTWSSSNSGIATVGSSTGIVTGVGAGTVFITYTLSTGCYTYVVVTVSSLAPITGPTSVQQGLTITLADATPGGTWSSSNTSVATIGTNGVVTGVTGGVVTITYTISGGVYVTYDVTVDPIQPITGPTSVLTGSTITLADATPGGTWSSGNTAIATIGTNGVVTGGSTTGAVTITYTVGGAYVTYDITVNPIQPITGPTSVLTGSTITLADATPGGTWSSSNTAIATIGTNGVVTGGSTTGAVTITYTVGGAYVTYDITVNPIQPITGPTSVLTGSTITLADATPGGTWSSSNTAIATIGTNGVVTGGSTTGAVTITYTVGGAYVTYDITVNPIQPITGPTSVLTGNTITLADATPGGTWSSSNTAIATIGTNGVVTGGSTTGAVTITYTVGGAYVTYDITVNPIQPITGPTSVLTGSTITLADATPGGTWSSGNTAKATIGTNGVVTGGSTTGAVTITYTVGGAYVTYDITVNPIQPITGPTSVLTGSTITLADATPGGTWSSSNTAIATIGTNGVVTGGSTTGAVTITYTVGGAYVTYDITVNPIQPITGPTSVLTGSTITLADATPGGTWSSSNTAIATIGTNGVVTGGSTTGAVTITYTVGGAYVTYDITVNPIQPITGPTSVLTGNTITLADATAGGTWSSGNTAIATIGTNGVVTGGSTTGAVTITYTVGGAYVTYDITVNPIQPITGPTSVLTGNTITLADATAGGTWSSSNTAIATIGTNGVVTGGSTTGAVTITYTVGGAYVTYDITVNPIQPITGPTSVLTGNTITLADATPGGTWSSSNTAKATIGTNGVVTGGSTTGPVTITYTVGGAYVTYDITVNPIQPITGPTSVLTGSTITLADATPGGTWSSGNTAIATIGTNGVVTGGSTTGAVTITYTVGGAYVTYDITVNPIQPITGPTSVLTGSTITLADATPGGTWSSSNTAKATIGTNGVVTGGSTTGAVTITYTVGGAYVTYDITVNPIQPITGPTSVLTGNTITLADATPGGTWSSSNTAIATIGTNGVVTGGSTTGAVTITYTVGGAYVTYDITVNPIQPITGPTSVLTGSTITLADATAGGTWSSGNTAIATIGTNGVVTGGSTTGAVTITYTVGGAYVTYDITVNPIQPITGPTSVLTGSTITLADATPGGTWSSSNTAKATIGTNGVVTGGSTTGPVTITYTVGGAYVTYDITVNPIQPITGPTSVLTGSTITLADATAGGTWSSGNTAIATIGTNGVVTGGSTTGAVTITYTVGGAYVTYDITVNPIQPITGPTSVLTGSTITLADATPGGTWSSSNTAIATIGTNGVVTGGSTTGAVTITYTVGGAYVTYDITVNPIQPITGPTSVLTGSTITLADATPGGMWSSGNTAIATIGTNGVVTGGSTTGAVTITYTVGGAYVTYDITVNPIQPITGPTSVLTGSTITLADATPGGTWSSGNTAIATIGTNGVVTGGSTTGAVTITYTVGGAYVTYDITVNPIQPITGPTSVLTGNTITLADATPGGTWSSSNTAIATIGTGGVLSGITTGTVTITYTVGTAYVTYVVTVNPNVSNFTSPTATSLCLGATSTVTVNSTSLGTGTFTVTYNLSGANTSTGNTATLTMGASSGTFTILSGKLASVGSTTVTITAIGGADGSSSSVSSSNTASFSINANPNTTNFTSPTATSPCQGNSSTVTVNSTSLGSGTFTVTYNLGGANVSTGNTATLTMGTSNGTFTVPSSSLASTGSTTVTITSITNTSSCSVNLSSNNTATLVVKANPNISSFTTGSATSPCLGAASTVTVSSSSLGTGTFTVTYNLSGTNTATGNTATLTMGATSGTFSISSGSLTNTGSTTVTITSIANSASCNTTITSGNTAAFNVIGAPSTGTITGTFALCPAGTTTLTSTVTGGTWTSSTPSVATVGSATGLLTGVTAGTARITYTVTNSCFSSNTNQIITINPNPAAGTITGTATVCPSATTTFSNATSGGVWSSSNTAKATVGTSGIVTGVAAGTALISYSVTNSCGTAVATKAVTVNPLPTVAAISGASAVCASATTTLTCTTTGGVWTSGNTGIATVGSTTGIVSGVSAGNVTISYSVTNTCGTTTVIKAMTVNPLAVPGTITGTQVVCVSATTTLADATTGGVWSSGNIFAATVGSTGVVTGVASGTAPISYSVTNGCGTVSAIVNVTVNPLPDAGTISGVGAFCQSSTTYLSNILSGGVWSSSATSIATVGTNGVVSGAATGTATISYTVTNSCGTAYTTKDVTVNPLPSAGTLSGTPTLCVGTSTSFSGTVTGGGWSSGTISVATVSSTGLVTGLSAGTANINYIVSNGCGTSTATQTVTVNALPTAATLSGGGAICPGETATVVNSIGGGTWSSALPSVATVDASGLVTAVGSGYTPIYYTITNGCGSAEASIILTVNLLPDAGTVSGSSIFCNTSTSSFTSTVSGGVWSSSNTSVLTVASTGLATALSAGTSNISYTYTNSCGTDIDVFPVTINTAPDTIAGGNAIPTLGDSIVLTDAVPGGTWSSSNIALATVSATGTVIAVYNGYVTISYTLPNGCFKTRTISSGNPIPPITGNLSICLGTNSALACPGSTAGSSWTSSDTSIATIGITSGVVTPVAVGTSIITFTSLTGSFVTAMVTVNPLPTGLTATAICMGTTTTVSPTPSGGGWSSSNTGAAYVNTSNILAGIVAGTATITYTLETGCKTWATMTVNPIPNVVNGSTLTCVGVTTTLTSTSTGCTWSSTNTSVATIGSTSGIVTGAGAGTSTISYTNSYGCARTVMMSVNATAAAITGNRTLCVGGSVLLGNATSGGTWVSSTTAKATVNSSTGSVYGVAIGTSTISYTTAGGCRSTAVVTVNAAPAAITGLSAVLLGTTTIYTHPVSGGTWSSSNTSMAFVDPTLGNISGLALGTPTITYKLSEGCFSTKAISVVDTGGLIAGVKTVCQGSTTVLSSPAYSGVTWVSGNTSVATIGATSGVVTGISVGTAIITFTSPTIISTAIVTVTPLPTTITGSSTVCALTNATLSSIGTTGGTWASSNLAIGTIVSTTGVFTGRAAGTTMVTYTWTNGCKRTTIETVNPAPNAGAIVGTGTFSVGVTVSLASSQPGGVWASANTAIGSIGSSSGMLTGIAPGNVTISYTNTNSCGSATVTRIFTVLAPRTGAPIAETANAETQVSIFPNPTTGAFTLRAPGKGKLVITGVDGKTVFETDITDTDTNISIANKVASGVYMCRFMGDDGSISVLRLVYEP